MRLAALLSLDAAAGEGEGGAFGVCLTERICLYGKVVSKIIILSLFIYDGSLRFLFELYVYRTLILLLKLLCTYFFLILLSKCLLTSCFDINFYICINIKGFTNR